MNSAGNVGNVESKLRGGLGLYITIRGRRAQLRVVSKNTETIPGFGLARPPRSRQSNTRARCWALAAADHAATPDTKTTQPFSGVMFGSWDGLRLTIHGMLHTQPGAARRCGLGPRGYPVRRQLADIHHPLLTIQQAHSKSSPTKVQLSTQ